MVLAKAKIILADSWEVSSSAILWWGEALGSV